MSDGFDSGVFLPAGTDEGDGVYNYSENNYPRTGGPWRMVFMITVRSLT